MARITVYEYDRKNRDRIVAEIEKSNAILVSWSYFTRSQQPVSFPASATAVYIDLSSLFYSEDRSDALIAPAEVILTAVQGDQRIAFYLIVERQHSKTIQDLLYYMVSDVISLEGHLGIENDPISNIVDIDDQALNDVLAFQKAAKRRADQVSAL